MLTMSDDESDEYSEYEENVKALVNNITSNISSYENQNLDICLGSDECDDLNISSDSFYKVLFNKWQDEKFFML